MSEVRIEKSTKQYKNNILKLLFEDDKRAIELCNTLIGSSYPETAVVVQCGLESSLARRYNDVAFAVEEQLLCVIEHQATIDPNMPVRLLCYVTDILYASFIQMDLLYKNKLFEIPTPKIYVLYNGKEKLKETTLRLSNAFKVKDGEAQLELIVHLIDVNHGADSKLLETNPRVAGYAYLIEQVRIFIGDGHTRDRAIRLALEEVYKRKHTN
jgi:hypothetical protein